jgi:hypothetical protein
MPETVINPVDRILGRVPERDYMPEALASRAYWARRIDNMPWAVIARECGMSGESVARMAAQRHARLNNLPPLTVPNERRSRAARVAVAQRFNRLPVMQAPIQPQQVLRTYGVEIEYIGAQRAVVAAAVAQALGVPHIHTFGYHGQTCETCAVVVPAVEKYSNWKVERDGSVPTGGEVVSPILQGAEGFAQLAKVTKAIQSVGGKTNRRCGLHVHIGMKDLSKAQRANLVENWWNAYPVLKRLVGKSRWTNRYCSPINIIRLNQIVATLRDNTASEPRGIKYEALNVEPFEKIGTYEFRLHQGTVNATKIEAWVRFLLAFIENSQKQINVASVNELIDAVAEPIVAKVNPLNQRQIAYLKGREMALHRELQPAN